MSAGSTFTLDQLSRRLLWEDIDVAYLTEWLCFCRQEDFLGKGLRKPPVHAEDVTTNCVQGKMEGAAVLKAKVPLWVCGLGLVPLILEQYGEACSFVPYASDGKKVGAGESLGMIKGNAAVLLEAERLVLNCLQHLSGIATQTARYLPYFDSSSTRLLDTRKTTPGWRILEKYAVACAGGWNHRFGLFDRILFKDNHRALAVARGVPFTEFLGPRRAQPSMKAMRSAAPPGDRPNPMVPVRPRSCTVSPGPAERMRSPLIPAPRVLRRHGAKQQGARSRGAGSV